MEKRYEKFTSLIARISRSIQKIKNEEMSHYGLKGKQVQCLFALYNCDGGLSLTKLCDLCGEDKGAMSRTVKELTLANFVYTEECDDKKYRNPIKLTDKGQKIAGDIAQEIDKMITRGSEGINEVQRENMYATLTQISNNLAQICDNYGGKND